MAFRKVLFAVVMGGSFQSLRPSQDADPDDDVARTVESLPKLLAAVQERVAALTAEETTTVPGKGLLLVSTQLDEAVDALRTVSLVLELERRASCEQDRTMIRARVQQDLARLIQAVARATSAFSRSVDALDPRVNVDEVVAKAKVQLECVTTTLRRSSRYRAALSNGSPGSK